MRYALTALLLLGPSAALAHNGHHQAVSTAEQMRHLLLEPDHLLALAALMALALAGGWRLRRARAQR